MAREQEETQGGPGGLGGLQGARRPKPRGKGGNLGELRQQQRRVGEGKEGRGSRGRAVRGPPRLSGRAVPGRGLALTVSPRPCRPPSFSGIRVGPAWLSPLFRSPCSAPGAGLGTGGWIRTPEGCALA